MRRSRLLVHLALANLVGVILVLGAVEIAGRIFLRMYPAYDVVFLQPDRAVGWTQVPGLEWTWAGMHWYARDFSADVRTNSHGFRDRERSLDKAPATVRVALLGDSMVEAIQVPLEQTASQVLERALNADARAGSQGIEVLNFGISNYGVGQYLLAWETYARRFAPDFVVAYVAGFHLVRTIQRYEPGAFRTTAGRWLWVRPTFRLDGATLVREPAADYEEFVRLQDRLVQDEFGGRRMRRRASSVVAQAASTLWTTHGPRPAPPLTPPLPLQRKPPGPDELLAINLAVLRELGRQVVHSGARFAIADAAEYMARDPSLSRALAGLCAEEGFGHIPVAARLREAKRAGRVTYWAHDGHFNVAGNAVFAEALHEWLAPRVGRRGTRVIGALGSGHIK